MRDAFRRMSGEFVYAAVPAAGVTPDKTVSTGSTASTPPATAGAGTQGKKRGESSEPRGHTRVLRAGRHGFSIHHQRG